MRRNLNDKKFTKELDQVRWYFVKIMLVWLALAAVGSWSMGA